MRGLAYYNGDQVSIVEIFGVKALIICSFNPIESLWVNITDLDRITWTVNNHVS